MPSWFLRKERSRSSKYTWLFLDKSVWAILQPILLQFSFSILARDNIFPRLLGVFSVPQVQALIRMTRDLKRVLKNRRTRPRRFCHVAKFTVTLPVDGSFDLPAPRSLCCKSCYHLQPISLRPRDTGFIDMSGHQPIETDREREREVCSSRRKNTNNTLHIALSMLHQLVITDSQMGSFGNIALCNKLCYFSGWESLCTPHGWGKRLEGPYNY